MLGGYFVLICVIAPLVEEFFFRGFIYTVLWRRLGPLWARADRRRRLRARPRARSVGLAGRAGRVRSGVVPALLAHRSIVPGMALHALNNSITFGAIKDLDPARLRRRRGPVRRRRHRRRHRPVRPPAGGRMRRAGLALLLALAVPATASAQTPPHAAPDAGSAGAPAGHSPRHAVDLDAGHVRQRRAPPSPGARSPRAS